MLDINLIREQPDLVRKALADRQMAPDPVDAVLELDEQRRSLIQEVEALKAERNLVSKEIGRRKDAQERQRRISAMRAVGEQIDELDERLRVVDDQLSRTMSEIPNIPDPLPWGVHLIGVAFDSATGNLTYFTDPLPY